MSQFGQPPLAAFLPLRAGQNLADLPDKAAALTNLGTLSTSDIMLNSVPIGTIIPFWGTVAPVGYLPCSGQTVNSGTFPDLVTFLGGGSSQTLPDLRGEFLRGWDNGRGVDIGRAIKTAQLDAFQGHWHDYWYAVGGRAGAILSDGFDVAATIKDTRGVEYTRVRDAISDGVNGTPRVGKETRPRNVSVLYCMKAYGALVNTSTANIGNVLTELSQTTKITQFDALLSTNGYQKLPGGLIFQWVQGATSTATEVSEVVTLPINFPNTCLFASASTMNAAASASADTNYHIVSKTASQITVFRQQNPGNALAVAPLVLAIGY